MRRSFAIARMGLLLGLSSFCSRNHANQATLRIDLTALHEHARLGQIPIDVLELRVFAGDITPPVKLNIDPNAPLFEILVPAGPKRHVEVAAWARTPEEALRATYWSERVLDLLPRTIEEVVLPVYPAGTVSGSVRIHGATGTTAPFDLYFVPTQGRTGQPRRLPATVREGEFTRPLPTGTHRVEGTLEWQGMSFSLTQEVSFEIRHGETTELRLVMVPPNYCDPDLELTPDADGDGANCSEDCNDGDPLLNLSDEDSDGISSCDGDCDDTRVGCTTDCSVNVDGDAYCGEADCDDSLETGADCVVCSSFYVDTDGDGLGDPATAVTRCSAPTGYIATGGDCDDQASTCRNNCTINADADSYADCADACVDLDGDGYGPGHGGACVGTSCDPGGICANGATDCDDQASTCNSDCSVNADSDSYADCADACVDLDGDGYGASHGGLCVGTSCDPGAICPNGAGDCDDQASTCVSNCYANTDADSYIDCADACVDADRDLHGTGHGGSCQGTHCDPGPACSLGTSDCDDTSAVAASCFLGCQDLYRDQDGDGAGDPMASIAACSSLTGYVATANDCDDQASTCIANCGPNVDGDGFIDCADACVDGDNDTWGSGHGGSCQGSHCDPGPACAGGIFDCDDTKLYCNDNCSNPDGDTACVTYDCDESPHTGSHCFDGCNAYYLDVDGDGVGTGSSVLGCLPLPSHAPTTGDCDDLDPNVYFDCDTCLDNDGDGFPANCDQYVTILPDCDDTQQSIHPLQPEHCSDGIDNNCDGIVDDADPACSPSCPDGDNDGYRCTDCDDTDDTITPSDPDGDGWHACTVPTDCRPNVHTDHPGGPEYLCADGLDNDCDGLLDGDDMDCFVCSMADLDGDHYTVCEGDTSDDNHLVFPGRAEHCFDGLDNDLNAVVDDNCSGADTDLDGYIGADCNNNDPSLERDDKDLDGYSTCDNDCDDFDPLVVPVDLDGDGITGCDGDCYPLDPSAGGGAVEICDGIDNDCDGMVDEDAVDGDGDGVLDCVDNCPDNPNNDQTDADGDGAGAPCDCDDTDPESGPQSGEDCGDSKDNDCDGDVDLADTDCPGTCSPGDDMDSDGFFGSTCVDAVLVDCNDGAGGGSQAHPGIVREDLVTNGCTDSLDNDCDSAIDGADAECLGAVCDAPVFAGAVAPMAPNSGLQSFVPPAFKRSACSYGVSPGSFSPCMGTGQDIWLKVNYTDDEPGADAQPDVLLLCNASNFTVDVLSFDPASCAGTLCAQSNLVSGACYEKTVSDTGPVYIGLRAISDQCASPENAFMWVLQYRDYTSVRGR